MNKNSKRLKSFISQCARKGQNQVEYDVPGFKYHDYSKPTMVTRRINLSECSAPKRNMQMVILKNQNENGQKDSRTKHLPLVSGRPVIFKNHSYLKDQYEQPKNIRN